MSTLVQASSHWLHTSQKYFSTKWYGILDRGGLIAAPLPCFLLQVIFLWIHSLTHLHSPTTLWTLFYVTSFLVATLLKRWWQDKMSLWSPLLGTMKSSTNKSRYSITMNTSFSFDFIHSSYLVTYSICQPKVHLKYFLVMWKSCLFDFKYL